MEKNFISLILQAMVERGKYEFCDARFTIFSFEEY
jgi:hypothetical protein